MLFYRIVIALYTFSYVYSLYKIIYIATSFYHLHVYVTIIVYLSLLITLTYRICYITMCTHNVMTRISAVQNCDSWYCSSVTSCDTSTKSDYTSLRDQATDTNKIIIR